MSSPSASPPSATPPSSPPSIPPTSVPPPTSSCNGLHLKIDAEPDDEGRVWAGLFLVAPRIIEKHTDKWTKVSIHTAKCDHCSEHNACVLQRCGYCNRQICFSCMGRIRPADRHYVNHLTLDWTPEPVEKDTPGAIAKRGAKRGPMGKSGIRAKVVPKAKAGTKTGAGVQKRVRKGAKEAAA